MGTRRVPKPWSLGISFSAILGSLTRCADLPGDEIADQRIGLAVGQHVAEIALPHGESRRRVLLLEEGFALLGVTSKVPRGSIVWMKAGEGLLAALEHRGIVGLDAASARRRPIGPLCSGLHQLGVRWNTVRRPAVLATSADGLHAGGAGADHGDALAGEVDASCGQRAVWHDCPWKRVDALDARQGRCRQRADGGDEEARARGGCRPPASRSRCAVRPRQCAAVTRRAELDVAAAGRTCRRHG